ncbi:MAG: zf-HC2 domain-containing protein [Deltaproteobacteria bacterium]|nr:zf-HC2 domain-containing protein [Deltaproteobacteria bacterium]
MKCQHVLARLNAYVDGELSGFRSRRICRHVEGCPSCQAQLAHLGEVSRLLGELSVPAVPEGLAARVAAEAVRRTRRVERLSPIEGAVGSFAQTLRTMSVSMRVAACGAAVAASLVGVFTAGQLVPAHRGQAASVAAMELDGLEWFGSAPPESIAAAYLTVGSPEEGGR